jgi:hypothetical protein
LLSRFNINYIQYAENICRPKLCPPPGASVLSLIYQFVTHFWSPRNRDYTMSVWCAKWRWG